jgi:cytochrome c oxidase subunit 2
MNTDLPIIPAQGSTTAAEVDRLFLFLLVVSVIMSVLIGALLVFFAIRFRRQSEDFIPQPIVGSTRLEIAWMIGPLLVALVMFVWSASAYVKAIRPPDDADEVYVVAKQWMWKVQHPGGQREINTLHVPAGRPVKLIMTSEDVIHSFYVPEFRIKQDVLPGRYTTLWFEPTQPGTYHLFCAEYCGTGHSVMGGKVEVMEPEAFRRWQVENADGSLAREGAKQFRRFQCVRCHTGEAGAQGPSLEGIFRRRRPLADGTTVVVDEGYLRESILKPAAKVAAGYQPIMPTFEGQATEEEIVQLIAFIKALRPGETPPQINDSDPPQAKPKAGPQ